MNDVVIGIIGGTRGMGRWLALFLEKEGYQVHVSGRQKGMTVREMAERCNVVIVSVPIGVTTAVIEALGPHMRGDSLLMDITSLKGEPVKAMLKSSSSEVVGCHPLFGPRIRSIAKQNIILCPARGKRWIPWLRDLFHKHGAVVTETTPEIHDRMMAIIQGLNHFNTAAIGIALSRSGVSMADLKPFFTPMFRAKLKIVQRMCSRNPGLYAEILTMNPDILPLLEIYTDGVNKLSELVHCSDTGGISDLVYKCRDDLDF
jgi:prephenate dehydrogenase